ncbi:MAG: hypothetical protein NT169_06965 [Chloroflexi bacterium]|nr:hypothetical protein [Chloroflexota bacterium]
MRTCRPGIIIIAIAVVWAATILAVSLTLGGTPYAAKVLSLMGGGAAATIVLLGGLNRQWRKDNQV